MKQFCIILLTLLLGIVTGGDPAPNRATGPAEGTLEVHFIDVGQADSALLLCGGKSMLIDGGNVEDSSLVVSYLMNHGVEKLDYVVDSHAHEDHVGGLAGPLYQYPTETVYAPVTDYNSKAFHDFAKYAGTITIPAPGDSWALDGATVTVLGPQKDYEETNNSSIVLRVDFGATSFLFTGDAERQVEQDMLDAGCNLQATVLKVGHHGSDTSSSYPFLRAVAPQYAVVSAGTGNAYGHPTETVLSRLRDAAVMLYRTDLQGDVVAVSDGKTVSFAVERNAGSVSNPTEKAKEGSYVGNTNSKVFHRDTCAGLPDWQNRVAFAERAGAVAEGYTPCGRCKP